jgi:trk system potassium uptake protein TrkA
VMRALIAGAGRAGIAVASHLREVGHEVTIIDRDPAAAERAFDHFGLVAIAGDATEARVLDESRVAEADVVVALLRRDAENLAVALLARASGVKRVMVRMRDPAYRAVYENAGVDRILSETDVFVGALATAIEHAAVRHAMVLGTGDAIAFELCIPERSRAVGRTVAQLASDAVFPDDCVIAGMFEANGRVVMPRGASIFTAGMNVLLVSPRKEISAVIEFFLRP